MSGLALPIARAFLSVSWLWVLALRARELAGLAHRHNADSMAVQYFALAGYVVAEG